MLQYPFVVMVTSHLDESFQTPACSPAKKNWKQNLIVNKKQNFIAIWFSHGGAVQKIYSMPKWIYHSDWTFHNVINIIAISDWPYYV